MHYGRRFSIGGRGRALAAPSVLSTTGSRRARAAGCRTATLLTPVDERFNRCLAGHCCWAWPAAEDSQWWQLMNRSCGAAQPLFCTPSAVRAPLRLPQLQSAAALAVVGCSRPPLACSGPRAWPTQHTHENRGLSANLFESQGGVVHDTVRHCTHGTVPCTGTIVQDSYATVVTRTRIVASSAGA